MAILSPDGRSAPPPWADDAPARRAIGRRLGPDHPARALDRAVARIDLGPFRARYGRTGSPPHRPGLRLRACPPKERRTPTPEKGRTVSRGEHEGLIEALRARMGTAEAKALDRRRRQTVELVNADWKAPRGLRRFSGRGLERARCQVGVPVLAHDRLTLLAEEKKAPAERTQKITA